MNDHPLGKWLNLRLGRAPEMSPISAEELQKWQFDQLRKTLLNAVKSCPFYYDHLAGIQTGAIHSPADLARLPFTSAEDLRSNPENLLCVSQDEIARAVTLSSSGSSGPPKRLFFTAGDLERTIEFFHYGMSPMIATDESVLAILPDSRPGGVGSLFAEAISRIGGETFLPVTPSDIGTMLNLLLDSHASCIVGPAIQIHALAKLMLSKELTIGHVKSVLLCWDMLPETSIQIIESMFGCKVFTHWGMTETGLGGGVDCCPYSGMHLREPDFYVEIINPATEQPVPHGERGEIVLTTLSRRAMPLIRYRTGDIGCIAEGECSCGLPMRRLKTVTGRLGEGITLPGSDRMSLSELNEIILPHDNVLDFQATYSPARMEFSIELDVIAQKDITRDIKKALFSYRKIKQAVENHNLKVQTRVVGDERKIHSGFAKRSIIIN